MSLFISILWTLFLVSGEVQVSNFEQFKSNVSNMPAATQLKVLQTRLDMLEKQLLKEPPGETLEFFVKSPLEPRQKFGFLISHLNSSQNNAFRGKVIQTLIDSCGEDCFKNFGSFKKINDQETLAQIASKVLSKVDLEAYDRTPANRNHILAILQSYQPDGNYLKAIMISNAFGLMNESKKIVESDFFKKDGSKWGTYFKCSYHSLKNELDKAETCYKSNDHIWFKAGLAYTWHLKGRNKSELKSLFDEIKNNIAQSKKPDTTLIALYYYMTGQLDKKAKQAFLKAKISYKFGFVFLASNLHHKVLSSDEISEYQRRYKDKFSDKVLCKIYDGKLKAVEALGFLSENSVIRRSSQWIRR
jgi:hypothetical protein